MLATAVLLAVSRTSRCDAGAPCVLARNHSYEQKRLLEAGHLPDPGHAWRNISQRYEAACQRGADLDLPRFRRQTFHLAPSGTSNTPSVFKDAAKYSSILPRMTRSRPHVPRLLHQTWKSCEVIPRQRSYWDRCARLSPTWHVALWTDDANRAFVAKHFPQQLAMYDGYDTFIKRVDAVRYMLLYHYGGVYMDLDFACVRSLDTIPLREMPGEAILLYQRRRSSIEAVSNAFMAAPPRHPFFGFLVNQLASSRHRSGQRASNMSLLTS